MNVFRFFFKVNFFFELMFIEISRYVKLKGARIVLFLIVLVERVDLGFFFCVFVKSLELVRKILMRKIREIVFWCVEMGVMLLV